MYLCPTINYQKPESFRVTMFRRKDTHLLIISIIRIIMFEKLKRLLYSTKYRCIENISTILVDTIVLELIFVFHLISLSNSGVGGFLQPLPGLSDPPSPPPTPPGAKGEL